MEVGVVVVGVEVEVVVEGGYNRDYSSECILQTVIRGS